MTKNLKSLLGATTYFHYLPPVRFVRIESMTPNPKFIVPLPVGRESDLAALAADLTQSLGSRRIGLDLDFCPPLLQASGDIDTVRDFVNPAAALNFYRQVCASDDPRAMNISFLADNVSASKRSLNFSKFTLASKHLYAPAKRYYKVVGVECLRLIDLEEHHINEAGLVYAPHNQVKGKLNSRFSDSLESIYRDFGYKAKANGVVAVLTVERVQLDQSDLDEIVYELDHFDNKQCHIATLLAHLVHQHNRSTEEQVATATQA